MKIKNKKILSRALFQWLGGDTNKTLRLIQSSDIVIVNVVQIRRECKSTVKLTMHFKPCVRVDERGQLTVTSSMDLKFEDFTLRFKINGGGTFIFL